MDRRLILGLSFLAALLAGCSSGPPRRVSQPAASIQQLTVQADGSWSIDMRLQNYSSVSMSFDAVRVDMTVDGLPAGSLQVAPGISIGPASADVHRATLRPSGEARIAVADALASRRPLAYTLKGKVEVVPDEGRLRSFEVDARNTLNPVPGLDGVLR